MYRSNRKWRWYDVLTLYVVLMAKHRDRRRCIPSHLQSYRQIHRLRMGCSGNGIHHSCMPSRFNRSPETTRPTRQASKATRSDRFPRGEVQHLQHGVSHIIHGSVHTILLSCDLCSKRGWDLSEHVVQHDINTWSWNGGGAPVCRL